MNRRAFLTLPLAAGAAGAAPSRPNVLILLADDLGSADLGCYGSEIETPNLNRLTSQGVRFDRFHSFPVCSPTRSADDGTITDAARGGVQRDPPMVDLRGPCE
jgi:Sulfatase